VTKAYPLIAVVDDEEPIRTALMRLMRSAGLTVETFGSGAEFLESLETSLPDCVVLDLHMPHMDGFNVQTHLARKCAALPVIIVTGHDFPKARERAMAGGASAFLRKPVHDRTLLDAISAATASATRGKQPIRARPISPSIPPDPLILPSNSPQTTPH
jgi:FixJ family two-component response regulator